MTEENQNLELHELEAKLSEQEGLRRDKLAKLQSEGKDPFAVYKVERSHSAKQIHDDYDNLFEKEVKVAGRLMSKRGQGKVIFADLHDRDGKIQLFVKLDNVGEDALKFFKTLDLGDLLAVTGSVFTTKSGEVSIQVHAFELIAKSIKPLPDKWHGLKDPDLRYRRREVDIITNPEVKETFIKRSRIIREIRHFLDERDYLEVETPILSPIAGGAAARPFVTHHNSLDIDMYLRIATELYLKRCIVAGFEKVYDMGKNFRNEGIDYKHNPEFTMIELYEAYADYNDMMDLTEELVSTVAQKVNGTMKINYEGKEIDLTPPWRRVTMTELVKEHAGIDFDTVADDAQAQMLAKEHKLEEDMKKKPEDYTKGEILNLFFEHYAEDKLIQPTLVTDYPVEISPLTKGKRGNEALTERFEGFINGSEICNAYSELNDPLVQRQRFEQQAKERDLGDDEAYMIDEEFMTALETGMPPTGGLGIGVDRIIMFLTGKTSIRDVLLFPTMKPLGKIDRHPSLPKADVSGQAEAIDFSQVKVEPLFEETVDFETFTKSDFRAVKVLSCEEVPKSKKLLKFTLDDGSGTDRIILSGIKQYYSPEELTGKTLIAITNLPPRSMMGIESCGMLLSAVHDDAGEEKLHLLMVDAHIPAGAKIQ